TRTKAALTTVKSARNIAMAIARRQPARIPSEPRNMRCVALCGGPPSAGGKGLELISGGMEAMADLPLTLIMACEAPPKYAASPCAPSVSRGRLFAPRARAKDRPGCGGYSPLLKS